MEVIFVVSASLFNFSAQLSIFILRIPNYLDRNHLHFLLPGFLTIFRDNVSDCVHTLFAHERKKSESMFLLSTTNCYHLHIQKKRRNQNCNWIKERKIILDYNDGA